MREMKDSGVEWIGEIPQMWRVCRLKNYALIMNGADYKDIQDDNGNYPVIGSGGEFDRATKYLYDGESVLLGRKGTIDKPRYINGAFWTVDTMYYTKINNIGIAKYLYYLCTQIQFDYYQYGSAVPSMTQRDLNSVYFPLPEVAEQEKIVKYLEAKCSKIDDIIKKQQAIIEKLKEYKLSIINEAVTQGINPDVNMKQSGYKWIGNIPEHWNMVYAKHLFTQRKDRAFEADEQLTASQKYGIILQKEFMEIEGRQVMQVLKGEEILKHVEKGDFVISMRSFQGGLEYSEVSGKISSAYVMLIPNSEKVYDRYYKWLFKSRKYISALQGTSNLIRDGQALRFSNFVQVYLPSFALDEQKQIADYLDDICPKIDKEIEKRERLLEKVMEYKKSLIYEVVTGKKEV